jgi:hypothetical protein
MGVIEVLNQWAIEKEDELRRVYTAKKLKASGSFSQSLRHEFKDGHLTIYGGRQIEMMISGRAANRDQSPEALKAFVGFAGSTFLKKWVADKGLTISPFAVAYKIAREGVTVPNRYNDGKLLTDVFGAGKLEDLKQRLGKSFEVEISTNIKQVWRQ